MSGGQSRIPHHIQTTRESRVLRVPVPEQIKRMPTLQGSDAGPLPTLQHLADKSGVQESAAPAHRQVPRIIDHQTVPNIEARVAALVLQSIAVARESAIGFFRSD